MNLAPSSTPPRAARRTSCLGTLLLVLVLWSVSVVVLAAHLPAVTLLLRVHGNTPAERAALDVHLVLCQPP